MIKHHFIHNEKERKKKKKIKIQHPDRKKNGVSRNILKEKEREKEKSKKKE